MTKAERKADEKQDRTVTKRLTPAQKALFRKADSRHDAQNMTRAQDAAEDKKLVAKIKKGT